MDKERIRSLAEKSGKKCRLEGAGRKPALEELEQSLHKKIQEMREKRTRVSIKFIQLEARKMFQDLVEKGEAATDSFVASNGWLEKFMSRYRLTLRRRTTVCQKLPHELLPKLISYVAFVRMLQLQNGYKLSSIYAADETAIWFDMVSETTVDTIGTKEISIRTTGHEKMRITVTLTACANGKKCKPFIIFKRRRPLPALEKAFSQLTIAYNENGWMDETLTAQYLKRTIGQISFENRLLCWDAFRCHISESTKQLMKSMKIDSAVVPGGCTSLIQAPDVSWNKPFKATVRENYETWMSSGEQQLTKGGRVKAATPEIICRWIIDAWSKLPEDLIAKSFRACGLGLATDGSEDFEIHCFKEGGPCSLSPERLSQKVSEILKSKLDETIEITEDVDEMRENFAELEIVSDDEFEF